VPLTEIRVGRPDSTGLSPPGRSRGVESPQLTISRPFALLQRASQSKGPKTESTGGRESPSRDHRIANSRGPFDELRTGSLDKSRDKQKTPGSHCRPPGVLLLPGIAPAISTLLHNGSRFRVHSSQPCRKGVNCQLSRAALESSRMSHQSPQFAQYVSLPGPSPSMISDSRSTGSALYRPMGRPDITLSLTLS